MPSHLPFESKGSFGSPSRRGPIFRLSILILFVGLCLSSRSARADFSGRYFINATFQCPYYLRGDGEWDLEFRPENRQFKPCYGLHVVAKQPGTFGDSYCGEDYTAADGSVRIRASTDCDGDVFLSVEASSLQGFRVGTHDFPWWRAPLDAWLAYVTVGLAIPGEVYDFLVANKTFEWDSPQHDGACRYRRSSGLWNLRRRYHERGLASPARHSRSQFGDGGRSLSPGQRSDEPTPE